jgi:hypothetical protein
MLHIIAYFCQQFHQKCIKNRMAFFLIWHFLLFLKFRSLPLSLSDLHLFHLQMGLFPLFILKGPFYHIRMLILALLSDSRKGSILTFFNLFFTGVIIGVKMILKNSWFHISWSDLSQEQQQLQIKLFVNVIKADNRLIFFFFCEALTCIFDTLVAKINRVQYYIIYTRKI